MDPCIITINGVEYDVTTFTKRHPGGASVLRSFNGLDATQAFQDAGHSAKARAMLRGLVNDTTPPQTPGSWSSESSSQAAGTAHTAEEETTSTSLFTDKDVLATIPHVHKTLGFATLFTYALVLSGAFTPTPRTLSSLLLIAPAFLLVLSALIFHVPLKAPKSTKIHVEYRLHTILFSLRSILIYVSHWTGSSSVVARLGIIVLCHYCADLVTRTYHQPENGTTIRGDVTDIPSYGKFVKVAPYVMKFASLSQFGALYLLLFGGNQVRTGSWPMITAFGVLIPVQITAFLKTLVLKRKINPSVTGVLYNIVLFMGWACVLSPGLVLFTAAMAGARFQMHANKYATWTCLVALDALASRLAMTLF